MTLYTAIFYAVGIFIVVTTVLAVTRRHAVHAIVFLVASFFGTALLFYLLGAPFLAGMEVIIYAGAIMVLFLFVVMTLRPEPSRRGSGRSIRRWLPAGAMAAVSLAALVGVLLAARGAATPLGPAMASPLAFGRTLFLDYWLPVEIASFLLFVALVGALYLGRPEDGR